MNRMAARTQIESILKHNFKYIYFQNNLNINTIHLTFHMDSKSHNLQQTFRFEEKWCDVLCFISPTVLEKDSESYWQALQTINYINWNVKSWGRYYIDEYNDLAYSLRLDYNVLETMPDECTKEIEAAVDYYADLFLPLLKVGQGKATFEDTKEFIDEMWGELL